MEEHKSIKKYENEKDFDEKITNYLMKNMKKIGRLNTTNTTLSTLTTEPPVEKLAYRQSVSYVNYEDKSKNITVINRTKSQIFSQHKNYFNNNSPQGTIEMIPKRDKLSVGSLLELFKSELFDMNYIINYMDKYQNGTIFDTLVNEIYERHINKSYFYLPQLCCMLVYKDSLSLEQYLTEHCTDRLTFAVKIYWLIMSLKKSNLMLENKAVKIEIAMVNNKVKKIKGGNQDDMNDIVKKSLSKETRLNYFIKLCNFYTQLTNVCDALMKIEKEQRRKALMNYVDKLNKEISDLKNKSHGDELKGDINTYFYYGFLLPFEDCDSTYDEDTNVIVKILPEHCDNFNSKARVPVLFTFETIKVKELKDWEEKILKEQDIEKDEPEEKIIPNIIEYTSIEDFLEQTEINENIEIQKEIKEEPIIFNYNSKSNIYGLVDWDSVDRKFNPFGKPWILTEAEIKKKSVFKNFSTFQIKSYIYKSNDDLKQELMVLQLIKRCQQIFDENSLKLKLGTYDILITSDRSGMIEVVRDTKSIDQIKKFIPENFTLKDFFLNVFGMNFEEAQINFAHSLAAYSIVCYILQIKDRHNGNIMIDNCGNIIHIDFGFVLGINPGNINFESVPFKLTQEFIDILGGVGSEIYEYYVLLISKGLSVLRLHIDSLAAIIQVMKNGCDMPCFATQYFSERLNEFKSRFNSNKNEDFIQYARNLVNESSNSWRTNKYDSFQKLTNGIYY